MRKLTLFIMAMTFGVSYAIPIAVNIDNASKYSWQVVYQVLNKANNIVTEKSFRVLAGNTHTENGEVKFGQRPKVSIRPDVCHNHHTAEIIGESLSNAVRITHAKYNVRPLYFEKNKYGFLAIMTKYALVNNNVVLLQSVSESDVVEFYESTKLLRLSRRLPCV